MLLGAGRRRGRGAAGPSAGRARAPSWTGGDYAAPGAGDWADSGVRGRAARGGAGRGPAAAGGGARPGGGGRGGGRPRGPVAAGPPGGRGPAGGRGGDG